MSGLAPDPGSDAPQSWPGSVRTDAPLAHAQLSALQLNLLRDDLSHKFNTLGSSIYKSLRGHDRLQNLPILGPGDLVRAALTAYCSASNPCPPPNPNRDPSSPRAHNFCAAYEDDPTFFNHLLLTYSQLTLASAPQGRVDKEKKIQFDWFYLSSYISRLQEAARAFRDAPETYVYQTAILTGAYAAQHLSQGAPVPEAETAPIRFDRSGPYSLGCTVCNSSTYSMKIPEGKSVFIPGAAFSQVSELGRMAALTNQHFILQSADFFTGTVLGYAAEVIQSANIAMVTRPYTSVSLLPTGSVGVMVLTLLQDRGAAEWQQLLEAASDFMPRGGMVMLFHPAGQLLNHWTKISVVEDLLEKYGFVAQERSLHKWNIPIEGAQRQGVPLSDLDPESLFMRFAVRQGNDTPCRLLIAKKS